MKFGNGYVILSHSLLNMCLRIHAGIKLETIYSFMDYSTDHQINQLHWWIKERAHCIAVTS